MLFLLGGAARCGKTTLATRAAGSRNIGWLSTDTVRDVVNMLMPLFEPFAIGRSHGDEADGFYPRHVAMLRDELDVRAVFVGQSSVDLADMLEHEGRNRWHRHLDHETLALVPGWVEEWSAEIESECDVHGFPYVDLSPDFASGHAEAERLLFAD